MHQQFYCWSFSVLCRATAINNRKAAAAAIKWKQRTPQYGPARYTKAMTEDQKKTLSNLSLNTTCQHFLHLNYSQCNMTSASMCIQRFNFDFWQSLFGLVWVSVCMWMSFFFHLFLESIIISLCDVSGDICVSCWTEITTTALHISQSMAAMRNKCVFVWNVSDPSRMRYVFFQFAVDSFVAINYYKIFQNRHLPEYDPHLNLFAFVSIWLRLFVCFFPHFISIGHQKRTMPFHRPLFLLWKWRQ